MGIVEEEEKVKDYIKLFKNLGIKGLNSIRKNIVVFVCLVGIFVLGSASIVRIEGLKGNIENLYKKYIKIK